MKRIFNVAGPCIPNRHYMIPPLGRPGADVMPLIENEQYFVIHAARQSGKTTLLMDLTKRLNEEGQYYAAYCSLERAESVPEVEKGVTIVIESLQNAFVTNGLPSVEAFAGNVNTSKAYTALQPALSAYCRALGKPLVIFFDEADCLSGPTLLSFLRQLRDGYVNRALAPFVHSLALVGMRNIRDYRAEYRPQEQTLGSASPFNVVAETMSLKNFSREDIAALYGQHTGETGQIFESGAIDAVWEKTQGQPWLVNAIAREAAANAENAKQPVSAEMVSAAVQTLILRRGTHFDSLMARLREKRVRRVIQPILIGETNAVERLSDDYAYVKDLGLIRDDQGKVEPANPIYAEVIVRTLNWDTQKGIEETGAEYKMPRYLKNGGIDMDFLLLDFQTFWRENSGIWRKKYDYQEAAPHLIMQAFLQRVLNGGGQIIREMALSTERADLCVIYEGKKYPIELKLRRGEKTYGDGLRQTASYMDKLGCEKGWLVVFDTRKEPSWGERIFRREENVGGKAINVYCC